MLVVAEPPVFACRGRRRGGRIRIPCVVALEIVRPWLICHSKLCHPRVFPSCISRLGYKGGSNTVAGAVLAVALLHIMLPRSMHHSFATAGDIAAYHALIHLYYFYRVVFHP